jgi:hypothetical protein
MSALTVPMIHSATTTNKVGTSTISPPVNAERVTSIDPIVTAVQPNYPPTFEIHFTMAQDLKTGVPGKVVWKYANDAALQADLLLIMNTISVVVA